VARGLQPNAGMQSVVGVVRTTEDARRVAAAIVREVPTARVRVLTPESSAADLATVPTDESEQPGMGGAIGAVAGGAAGAAVGTLLLPPVGAVAILGIAAAALLGAVGVGSAGQAVEDSLAFGLPKDELFVYADALRDGRSVAIAYVDSDEDLARARQAISGAGVETIDAARDAWWVGLRDAEAAEYGDTEKFDADEPSYRRGFEAACRGDDPPPTVEDEAFNAGYARGRAYLVSRHQELQLTRPTIVDEHRDAPS
jgi:hypothetical protein